MGYSTASPPWLLTAGSLEQKAPNIWGYANTDAHTAVYAAGYITNAATLGMKKGDLFVYFKTDTPAIYLLAVTAVASTGSTMGTTDLVMS